MGRYDALNFKKLGAYDEVIEVGNTFAIELGVFIPERGYVSREENVVVTEDGEEYLCSPQKEVWDLVFRTNPE